MKKLIPKKISLNCKETLEAKELIRQRLLSDGSTENLVRWQLYGPENNHSLEVNTDSLIEGSISGKDVFLWMTNHEMMVCSPHLFVDPSSIDKGVSVDFQKSTDNLDNVDGSSDVEDFDDMKLDVIKLVNRARKQMIRSQKEGTLKPIVGLSHTTKVLSTYASLGSFANIFRETGALDLILELLWTNDAETRRAAGRMLRALALHDAGSRAYVLLSLTQNQLCDKSSYKQHYADFENRSMVMEMFAETASGEEANAVALDSVQLPQVPGKSLFTLMKCYLRVTSLMDGNGKEESRQVQKNLSWMHFDNSDNSYTNTVIIDFEFALAISDLIYELNIVMDWNSIKAENCISNKTASTTSSLNETHSEKIANTNVKIKKKNKTENSMAKQEQPLKMQSLSSKPLFLLTTQENAIDSELLASLLKSDESTTYRHPSSFSTRREYAEYLRSTIQPGYVVRACQSYQDVNEGDEGIYRQHNHSTPPVQVFWHRLNRTYWVYWHHIILLGEQSRKKEFKSKLPDKFTFSPKSSYFWPLLIGMQNKVKNLYGMQDLDYIGQNPEQNLKVEITQKDWWVLLFYTNRFLTDRKDFVKAYLSNKFPYSPHMCSIEPSKEDCFFIMSELLKVCSSHEKANMCSSSIGRMLINEIETRNGEDCKKLTPTDKNENCAYPSLPIVKQSNATSEEKEFFDETNIEERSKAMEMGLRIGFITNEETEKRYINIFLVKENFEFAGRMWKLCQDPKNLLKISKFVLKSERDGKIIALGCMTYVVKEENNTDFNKRKDLEEIFSNMHILADCCDSCVAGAYLQCLIACLQKRSEEQEEPEIQTKLALSGHLKTVFDMIVKFTDDLQVVQDAIICTNLITQASLLAKNPSFYKESNFLNLITVIITSIFVRTGQNGRNSTKKVEDVSILHAYLLAVYRILKEPIKENDLPITSQQKNHVLFSGICVLCMVAQNDQNSSLLSEEPLALQIVKTGLQTTTVTMKVHHMLQRFKGFLTSIPASSFPDVDIDSDCFLSDKSCDENSDDEDVMKNEPLSNDNERIACNALADYTFKIKNLPFSEARLLTSTVVCDFILPKLKKSPSITGEFAKSVAGLQLFLNEFGKIAKENNMILFEAYWPMLVSQLHVILEHCLSAVNKTSLEVSKDVLLILQTLCSLDKDFAVLLFGLEAKQTILKLQDKHNSVSELNKVALELCDIIGLCERQHALHNRLLAVILGGCISTALHCIEEARRQQKLINIPLFDQLLSNLCKGADFELKEDKCFEKLEVSSNPRQLSRLLDGNPKSYWESNGSSGAHWINIYMKKGVTIRKLTIMVAQEDSSYMPSRVIVFGGSSPSEVTTQLSCTNVGTTERNVVILENAKRYWPVVRISIRRCQQGGIDTRIHGVEVVGPKPSFWPLLRRQLYIRTSLLYSVQVHSWVADASTTDSLTSDQIIKHKILDVPVRLIKAIKFEQHFANEYLPNPESALVLGQACRSAFSSPIIHDLLSEPTGKMKSLLEYMLDTYIACNENNLFDINSQIFLSKLRRLLRLVCDLDQGGKKKDSFFSECSSELKEHKVEQYGIAAYNKCVQSLQKKLRITDVKLTRAESSSSVTTSRLSKFINHSFCSNEDNVYEPHSYLPKMSELWQSIVKCHLLQTIESQVATCTYAISINQCLVIAESIFDKLKSFQKYTQELFGSRSFFTLSLSLATWKSVAYMSYETKRKLCYIFNSVIHHYIIFESNGGRSPNKLYQLRASFEYMHFFLSLTVGTNFCNIFEELYTKFLLLRTASPQTSYIHLEEIVCKTVQSCFPHNQPVTIIQDLQYSRELNLRFCSFCLEKHDSNCSTTPSDVMQDAWNQYKAISNGVFEVHMFRPGVCKKHFGHPDFDLQLLQTVNPQIFLLMKEFELFFRLERTNHAARMFSVNKRSLIWTTECSYAILRDTKNHVNITANIKECLFLLQFNYCDVISVSSSDPTAKLLSEKCIITEQSADKFIVNDIIDKDVYCLDNDEEQMKLVWNVSTLLKESYSKMTSLLDQTIIRIIKLEGQCSIDVLIEKTIHSCSQISSDENNYMFCSANFVRARIEHLSSMGYLYKKDNSQLLIYNPDDGFQEKETVSCVGHESQYDAENKCENDLNSNSNPVQETNSLVETKLTSTDQNPFQNTGLSSFKLYGKSLFFIKPSGLTLKADCLKGFHVAFDSSMEATTISFNTLLSEIHKTIDRLSDVLSLDADSVEALLIVFEWNSDKMIKSFVTNQKITLSRIGVVSENASTMLSITSDENCPICMNPLIVPGFCLPYCKHVCCSDCWKAYLISKLEQNMACSATCPIGSCHSRITTKMYHTVFADDMDKIKKYNMSLVRSFVQSNRNYSYCHNPKGCDMIIRKSRDGSDEGWCSECGWQTCFTCTYVEAHSPASCSHMSQWIDDGGYYEGMSEDAQSKHLARLIAKRCPNCQANIEKNDGCLHMNCVKCGHDFCWRCLQSWRPTHQDYYNCSNNVSKLAQSNMKFVEFNTRCKHHIMAKLFIYGIRERLLSVNCSFNLEHLKFAFDLCTKLAHYRRTLAYCNVFCFYSSNSDHMNSMELHSIALEKKVLQIQELMNDLLLSNADIEYMVSVISEDNMAKGRSLISNCDMAVKIISEFAKQGMKVCSTKTSLSTTENGTLVLTEEDAEQPVLLNSRPAGMSDNGDHPDDIMSESLNWDNNQNDIGSANDDDDDDDDDDDINIYTDDEHDHDGDQDHYEESGLSMDYERGDDDNVPPYDESDSDNDFALFD